MKVRKARLSDLARVLSIERASFGPDSYSAATFTAHVFRDRHGSFVAEEEAGEVVGYALARMGLGWLGTRRGGITSIAVDPGQRRSGVGRSLLAHSLKYLRENRVTEADLEVGVNNRAGQSLYEAFGFRRHRVLPHYYGPNRDGLKMVVDLKATVSINGSGVACAALADSAEAVGEQSTEDE